MTVKYVTFQQVIDVVFEFMVQLYDELERPEEDNNFVNIGIDDGKHEHLVVITQSEYDRLIENQITKG